MLKYFYRFLLILVSSSSFAIEPEELMVFGSLSKPCLSGSMQEEDLMVCVSKGYVLAQKKLNSNYKVAIQQENKTIKNYLISDQKKWNLSKFRLCYPEIENGQEGKINFIDCATKVINDRNELLESVFLCDFNKKACQFKDDRIIDLLRGK
ncbi:hypothetical protein BKK56_07255 [Rodentibacter genomosp. 2]|nr:hypothetical protein BKK56_07255 [Rodentibacter genomosp. 2]